VWLVSESPAEMWGFLLNFIIMTKENYTNAANKQAVREFLFSFFKFNSIIGLGGPNINEYIKWCKAKGYIDIEIWENTPEVAIHQLMNIKHPVRMRFGDILQAEPDRMNTLYDLDYCCTVRYMKEHLSKFNDNFIMTFSRRIKDAETIKTFFKARKERIITSITKSIPFNHTLYKTDNGSRYIFVNYYDTSNMCCIAKIK
jgi:hypothetical protein